MSFDRTYLNRIHLGGEGGNSLWHYCDVNGDNVASVAGTTPNTTYFSTAYSNHGMKALAGDFFIIAPASNSGTPCIGYVPSDWDSNGASVIIAQPRFS